MTGFHADTKASEQVNRRSFVTRLGGAALGAAATVMGVGCGGGNNSASAAPTMDQNILNAAATAEALATVMYYNIINFPGSIYQTGPLSTNAPDKAYLVAGYEQELNHYNFLVSAGGKALATTFYFPTNMFTDPQVTVNTLVTLEVIASQIMGVEAEHRSLARVITNDLNLTSVSGLAGAESVTAPGSTANNLAYERTFSSALPDISHVVTALGPFVTPGSTGFGATAFPFSTANAAAPSAGQTQVTLAGTTP